MVQNILIVDDEVSIVTLLTYNIQQAGYETEVSFNGKDAIRKAMKHDFDLIILDLMLPEKDGLEVCKHLRDNKVHTPILMLTAKDNEQDKIRGLEMGADDYLTKPFSPQEVVARVNAILRRVKMSKENEQSYIQLGELIIFPDNYEVMIGERKLSFTRKEFELLLYLATNKGKVLSRDQLLKGVWNYDFVGDTRIVDVHISNLREKIEPSTKKPKYIKTVRGLGYKLEEPEEL